MMDSWQFFLQKEGDYAWLPLETPQVEILEGRYQLIAHTSKAGQSLQVNIRHQYEQEDIPQENIQESVRQIGLSGKVEILPLVYLGLGSWSISCHPQLEASNAHVLAKAESYDLEIQVLSQDFDLFEDWNFGDLDTSEVTLEAARVDAAATTEVQPAIPPEVLIPVEQQLEETNVKSFAIAGIDETLEPMDRPSQSTELLLPQFSDHAPSQAFRTVSSTELPRRVSDRILPAPFPTPQLPAFTTVKAVITTKQEQRSRSLTKIRFIAAAVSQRHLPNVPPSYLQKKFHSKLNQIAVGTAK